jgi:putative phage-type endonuclease
VGAVERMSAPVIEGPVLILPGDADRDVWLDARRGGIGASDIAAVCGLSKYKGPWDVWSSKVFEQDDDGPSDAASWGLEVEDSICTWWARKNGHTLAPGGLFRHPAQDWMRATPDRFILDDHGHRLHCVDAKNANWRMRDEWEDIDSAPIEYIVQIQWQCAVTGLDGGWLVGAIAGHPPVGRWIPRDDDLIDELIRRGAAFWQLVLDKTPPPIDGSDIAARWLSQAYAASDPSKIAPLDDDVLDLIRKWVVADDDEKDAKKAKQTAENAMKEQLGMAEIGQIGARNVVTWKTQERAGYEVAPTTFRRFLIPAAVKKEFSRGNSK